MLYEVEAFQNDGKLTSICTFYCSFSKVPEHRNGWKNLACLLSLNNDFVNILLVLMPSKLVQSAVYATMRQEFYLFVHPCSLFPVTVSDY